MKMKSIMVSLMLVSTAAVVQAVTYTWDGGGADNNWSTLANWNPDTAAPVSASNTWVRLDGTNRTSVAQNIASPFVLNRLEFYNGPVATPSGKAAFSLSGSPLQFVADGATQPRVYSDRQATSPIGNAIDIPSGLTLYADIGTWGVVFTGVISGGGSIDKLQGSGSIDLNNSANSFSGGLTVRAKDDDWYRVNVNASGAMGTGPVSLYSGAMLTSKTSPGGLGFYGTTTHTNPITLFQNSPIFAGMPNGSGTVTLNGPIDLNTTNTLYLRGGGTGTIGGTVSRSGANALTKSDAGTWTLGGANTFTGRLTLVNGTVKLGAPGALNPLVPVSFACATGWYSIATATLDLNGTTQTVSQLSGTTTHAWLTNILTSAAATTLTVDQSAATVFNGRLTGALSLVKAGVGSLTLSNYPSAMTGGITVSNGTLAVATGASLGSSTNIAVAGGTLDLRAAATIADAASLRIAAGAQVAIGAGLTETVDKLWLDGVQQAGGTYGAVGSGAAIETNAFFGGSGKILVLTDAPIVPVSATWDGEGSDTFMSTVTNWAGDVLPAFKGATVAVFGTGGATATVDTAVSLYGMVLNANTNFTVAAGSGLITNGAGGIAAQVPNATSRTYTVAEDIVLRAAQMWGVTNAGAGVTTLSIAGSISDAGAPCNVIKQGNGALTLSGNNTYSGTTTIKTGCVVRITSGTAFGSTNGTTTVEDGSYVEMSGGINLTESIALYGDASTSHQGVLRSNGGSNILSGLVLNGSRILCNAGSLDIIGGVAGGQLVLGANGTSYIRVAEKPINIGGSAFFAHTGALLILDVPSNVWGQVEVAGNYLRTDKANALPPASTLVLGNATVNGVNLNGNSQTVGQLVSTATNVGTHIVFSTAPATLTVNQSVTSTFNGSLTGAVSFVKTGVGSLTLSGTNTTYGSFIVSNGTLAVSGTLGVNSTNIVVGGSGTLALSNSVTIANSATVFMPAIGTATAKISPAAGVNEAVGWLYFGDKMQRAGTYSAANNVGAQVVDTTHFAGAGVLTVLHDKSGFLLRIQ